MVVFSLSTIIGQTLKNQGLFYVMVVALKIRKALIVTMYDKIGTLSMESLIKANSGKVITLISSDIFQTEKQTIFV